MTKPNKHRRALNRLKRERESLTKIHADFNEERVGLAGYENFYEITRKGEVYSKRLDRFIKHKFFYFGDNSSTYIEFQLKGEKIKFNVGEAVAKSYLTQEQIEKISKKLPESINNFKELWGLDIIDSLAKKYDVVSNAIFYIFRSEFSNRQLKKNQTPS